MDYSPYDPCNQHQCQISIAACSDGNPRMNVRRQNKSIGVHVCENATSQVAGDYYMTLAGIEALKRTQKSTVIQQMMSRLCISCFFLHKFSVIEVTILEWSIL